jgi:secretion/DNA translocation related CpaE-like protein
VPVRTPAGRPLLVSGDEPLVEEVLRLAGSADVEMTVVAEAGAARSCWAGASLVLVGDDQTAAVARALLPRRQDVVVLGRDVDDAGVWQRAASVGAAQVAFLPEADGWLVEQLANGGGSARTTLVVGIVAGRGGAGATTLAAALSFAGLRCGMSTLLVDADALGGGIDLVLGGEEAQGLRWPDLATAPRALAPVMLGGLPEVASLTVLSWDRGDLLAIPAEAMQAVLGAAAGGVELVVVDLPRHTDPAAEVVLARADRTFLVVPAEVRAVASAGRVAKAVGGKTGDLRVVVRGPAPTGLEPQVVAACLGWPLAGFCRAEQGLSAALDRGDPPGHCPGPLSRLADRLLHDLRHSRAAPTP